MILLVNLICLENLALLKVGITVQILLIYLMISLGDLEKSLMKDLMAFLKE
jgi:hypothetical protein